MDSKSPHNNLKHREIGAVNVTKLAAGVVIFGLTVAAATVNRDEIRHGVSLGDADSSTISYQFDHQNDDILPAHLRETKEGISTDLTTIDKRIELPLKASTIDARYSYEQLLTSFEKIEENISNIGEKTNALNFLGSEMLRSKEKEISPIYNTLESIRSINESSHSYKDRLNKLLVALKENEIAKEHLIHRLLQLNPSTETQRKIKVDQSLKTIQDLLYKSALTDPSSSMLNGEVTRIYQELREDYRLQATNYSKLMESKQSLEEEINQEFEKLTAISKQFSAHPSIDGETPGQPLLVELENKIRGLALDTKADILLHQNPNHSVTLRLSSDFVFRGGSDRLTKRGYNLISQLSPVIKEYEKHAIKIASHTDNTPIERQYRFQFRNNWDLTASRASTIALLLHESGLKPDNFHVSGQGQYQPLTSNSSYKGRKENRRIDITISSEAVQGFFANIAHRE